MGAHPLGSFCAWGLCLAFLVAFVVPLSLYESASGTWGGYLWWTFWVFGIMIVPFAFMGLFHLSGVSSQLFNVEGLLATIVLGPLIFAGWWLLKDYSTAWGFSIERGVTPGTFGELYQEGHTGVYVFQAGPSGGYVQADTDGLFTHIPSRKIEKFAFGCHGWYQERTCESCDSDGSCTSEECGYWVYPDQCPGYHHVLVAPYWANSGVLYKNPPPAQPIAMMFQMRTFLFDMGQDALRDAHIFEQTNQSFVLEHCHKNQLCAVDVRNRFVEDQWAKLRTAKVVDHQVGKYDDSWRPGREQAIELGQEAVQLAWRAIGKQYEKSVPMLWMPAESKPAFDTFEQDMEWSLYRGKVAFWLLGVGFGGIACLACLTAIVGACKGPSRSEPYDKMRSLDIAPGEDPYAPGYSRESREDSNSLLDSDDE